MGEKRSRGRPPHPDVLTPAEWGVVEGVRHGMSNGQIARRRGVSLDAVKQHVVAARDKLGLDDREALQDWEGVRMDSVLNRSKPGAAAPLELGPIGQIARSVKDTAAAEAWFRDVLGLKHLYTFGKLAFFDMGGVRLYLDEAGDYDSVLYFKVAEIHAAHAELQARGVAFKGAPHMIHRHADGTEEWMAFFEDNEGRTLALMSQAEP
jgi:catechol 2,3-dioxygenase-like lactoylglutathione lyase family enzyme/DNA-binding CsgD family transcriptional regulator